MGERAAKAALISFTLRGRELNRRLAQALESLGYSCKSYEKRKRQDGDDQGNVSLTQVEEPAKEWAGLRFADSDYLIFIGAAGIAVRSVAPWIEDKWRDPAVIVIDEAGRFVIPILSGHVGKANELAKRIAEILSAVPVITTATDINGKFAVDVFAVENGLWVTDKKTAKEISAEILAGGKIGVFSDYSLDGPWPKELSRDRFEKMNIRITRRIREERHGHWQENTGRMLKLVPKTIHVGIGCRKGASGEQIKKAVFRVLEQENCLPCSVASLASIDLKEKEPGLLWLAEELGVEFSVYSARQLALLEGEFAESDFVASVTGVGNVCERAALESVRQTKNGGRVICPKQAVYGVTVALAEESWRGIL